MQGPYLGGHKAFITLIDMARCDPPLQDDDPEAFGKVLQSVRAYWEKDSVHSKNGQGDYTATGADGSLGSQGWYREIMGEVDLIKILDEGIPEPSYLVDGLIPEGQNINMFGDEGRGKTWLALIFTVICLKQGKRVVYLDFENS